MRVRTSRFKWWLVMGLMLAAAAVACGSDEPDADEYLASLHTLAEQSDQRDEEIFAPITETSPASLEFLGLLADVLPLAIEATRSDIANLGSLDVPDDYAEDHATFLTFLNASADIQQRQLDAAAARDDLTSRDLGVEVASLQRNLLAGISQTFRDAILVSEDAISAGAVFGDLADDESAYLNTVERAYEEFRSRNAVFGETLRQQFSDSRALLQALQGAGAGTAFETVQAMLLPVEPPERFAADHQLLLTYLAEAVRLDREIGKAIDEVDPVHFVVSNLELGSNDASVNAILGLSPPVREIAFPGAAFVNPTVSDDAYLGPANQALKRFSAEFGRLGPNYLAFNIGREYAFEVIARSGPGYLETVQSTLATMQSLTPPAEFTPDHALILEYFDDLIEAQTTVLDSAAGGDMLGVNGGILETQTAFCDAVTRISAELKAAGLVLFQGPPDDPELKRTCPTS